MSVTFSLDRESRVPYPFGGDAEPTEEEVDAYFSALAEEGEFNVANGNAVYILRDILKTDGEMCGSMTADDLALRLSMVDDFSVAGGIKPTTLSARMFNFGRTYDQCERYVRSLVRLSKLALAEGVGIRWG